MNRGKLITCIFILTMLSSGTFANELIDINSVQKKVQEFCQAEFDGIRDIRFNLVKFSHKRKSTEEKRDPLFGGRVVVWEADPIFIVSLYKITEIRIKNKQAEATIYYNRLARTKGEGTLERDIIPDYKDYDIVKLKLVYEKGGWLIIDPPLPRVSIDYLIVFFKHSIKEMRKIFKSTIDEMGEKWLNSSNIPEGQKNFYLKMEDNLNILENIKSRFNEK